MDIKAWNEYYVENEAKFINAREKMWIQEDGKNILISQMSLDHLKNAIKYIDRKIDEVKYCPISDENSKKMKDKQKELKKELKKKSQL